MAAWRNGIASDYDPFGVCNQEIAGSTPAVVTEELKGFFFPKERVSDDPYDGDAMRYGMESHIVSS